MSKLALQYYQSKSINDLFMAVLVEPASNAESTTQTIVLKNGDIYINIDGGKEIDPATQKLKMIEPFSNYYSEGEYRFMEIDGNIVLVLDSMEPWEAYVRKVKEKL